MSGTANAQISVIPAQLSFLAIYNPSLGNTEETLADQIVFYSSIAIRSRKTKKSTRDDEFKATQEEENEKLRQIGLAQGMVDFAKNFSDGRPIDSIETEKSRIVLHELEPGWWILASIDLTRLPSSQTTPSKSKQESSFSPAIEYSSREVSPPELILEQLLRAHNIFLLHHSESLTELWVRWPRAKFCTLLERFWTRFVWNWDILLHGNPASDIYAGVKLAAGGELGIGVGEEEWGSGEREVLEGFVGRTGGLIDLVVSRFGDEPSTDTPPKSAKEKNQEPNHNPQQWLGCGSSPRSGDGVIFSGIGAISRRSLRDVSRWMEWIYMYGEDAYGVRDNPSSTQRRKRRPKPEIGGQNPRLSRSSSSNTPRKDGSRNRDPSPGIPPPIIAAAEHSLQRATKAAGSRSSSQVRTAATDDAKTANESSLLGTDAMMKYLTLGYGTSWSLGLSSKPTHRRVSELRQDPRTPASEDSEEAESKEMQVIDPTPEVSDTESDQPVQKPGYTIGRYIIGWNGDLENETVNDDESQLGKGPETEDNSQTILRSLHVEMSRHLTRLTDMGSPGDRHSDVTNRPESRCKRIQVVVYLHQPFVFTFLFEVRTPSLTLPSFYRNVHHQLGPLQKPLLSSTSPARVQERIFSSVHARTTSPYPSLAIYDLVYDPLNMTIHTSIPNIPEPGLSVSETLAGSTLWTRIEALNVHTQILNTYSSTRRHLPLEVERTCKTSRGWWVVWMRLPSSQKIDDNKEPDEGVYRESFLVRRASDYLSSSFTKKASGGSKWLRDISGSSTASAAGGATVSPGKVAEGIGIDARRYVEGLLSLNR